MEIKRDQFFLFFKGELSPEQNAEIMAWADESEENYAMLQEERMIFDMVNLASDAEPAAPSVRKLHFSWKAAAIAACFVALLSTGLFLSRTASPKVDMMAETCVTAPSGTRSQVTLPDGTQVWLNSGSTMRYSAFPEGKGKREVILDGQAKFDVAKDADHPFVVHTYLADIEVLGTSFDVIADRERNRFETALFTGKVSITQPGVNGNHYELAPSQKMTLAGSELKLEQIEDYDIYSWVDGLYCFTDKPFSQVLSDMENYFDIKVVCEVDQKEQDARLTGKFRLSDGLDYALRLFQLSTGLQYSYDSNNAVVTITR